MRGVVSKWNCEKACGWVEASDGGRFFAHKTEFAEQFVDGEDPPDGTPVTFRIGNDSKSGKERAVDIQFTRHPPSRSQDSKFLDRGEKMLGRLTEWNSEKACGWIESPQFHGRPLFAHKSEFLVPFEDGGEPPIGTPVSFQLGKDKKSGKERACQINVGDGDGGVSYEPTSGTGILVEWKLSSACGWIEVDGHPGHKLFCHKSNFEVPFDDDGAPQSGTRVSFVIGRDSKSGKERAQDIQLDGDSVGEGQKRPAHDYGDMPAKRFRD